jgi:hypothetical protein
VASGANETTEALWLQYDRITRELERRGELHSTPIEDPEGLLTYVQGFLAHEHVNTTKETQRA